MSEIVVDGAMGCVLVALVWFAMWQAKDLSRAIKHLKDGGDQS